MSDIYYRFKISNGIGCHMLNTFHFPPPLRVNAVLFQRMVREKPAMRFSSSGFLVKEYLVSGFQISRLKGSSEVPSQRNPSMRRSEMKVPPLGGKLSDKTTDRKLSNL